MFWKKLWVLFTVIWVVVVALQVGTILAVGEEPPEKIIRPIIFGIVVPVALYLLGLGWEFLRRKRDGKTSAS